MRKLPALMLILLLLLPVSADAGHRKRRARRTRARAHILKVKPSLNAIERRQLLDAATNQELLNELSHRWLSQFTLEELQAAMARREQKPK